MTRNEKPAARDHHARINIDDETWRAFRQAAPGPVSAVLGEMVVRELRRYRRQRVHAGTFDERNFPDLLADARELKDELAIVIARMEAYEAAPKQQHPGVWQW